MDTWYTKELGDGIMASTPAEEIRQAFQRSLQAQAGKAPPEMAVFTRLASEGRLHCERIAYFPALLPGVLAGDQHYPETCMSKAYV